MNENFYVINDSNENKNVLKHYYFYNSHEKCKFI